jgi:hypothetical protein
MMCAIEMAPHGDIHTKFHDNQFRKSSNIKGIYLNIFRVCNVGSFDERDFLSAPLRWPQIV